MLFDSQALEGSPEMLLGRCFFLEQVLVLCHPEHFFECEFQVQGLLAYLLLHMSVFLSIMELWRAIGQ